MPQARKNQKAWAQLIFQPDSVERFRGYRTEADKLFGEIIRYAVLRDERTIFDLIGLYQRILRDRMLVETRHKIYEAIAAAQQREPGAISCNAYLPFLAKTLTVSWDRQLSITSALLN
jgi:hypothetical protein